MKFPPNSRLVRNSEFARISQQIADKVVEFDNFGNVCKYINFITIGLVRAATVHAGTMASSSSSSVHAAHDAAAASPDSNAAAAAAAAAPNNNAAAVPVVLLSDGQVRSMAATDTPHSAAMSLLMPLDAS